MKPDISIEDFQKRVDELFFTFDKDDSLLLDHKEFIEFKQAYIGICMSCTATEKSAKNGDFDFDNYFFDREKLGLLDKFVDEKQRELDEKIKLGEVKKDTELHFQLSTLQNWLKKNMFQMK